MNKKALDSSFILHPFSRGQQQPRQPARQGGTNVLESGGEARRGVPELFQSSLRADGQRRRPPHPPVRRLLPRAHHGRMRRRRNRPVAERFPHRGDQRRQSIADAGALVCRHSGVRNHLPDFPLRLQAFWPKGHQGVTGSPLQAGRPRPRGRGNQEEAIRPRFGRPAADYRTTPAGAESRRNR
jgi:hypothetical protein